MPYIEELLDTGRSPHMRLYSFVRDANEVLGEAVEGLKLEQELHERIDAALEEYRKRGLGELLQVLEAEEIRFEALQAVGLTGRQLDAKMLGYAAARRRLLRRLLPGAWRRAARWMNSIMGSIAAAYPPAHAFQELKELIENGAKDIEELDQA